jgi:hypothetical protein
MTILAKYLCDDPSRPGNQYLADSSGNGHHLPVHDLPTFQAPPLSLLGYSIDWSTTVSPGYADDKNPTWLQGIGSSGFSIGAWVKGIVHATSQKTVVALDDINLAPTASARVFWMMMESVAAGNGNGLIRCLIYPGITLQSTTHVGQTGATAYRVLATYDALTLTGSLYVNGALESTGLNTASANSGVGGRFSINQVNAGGAYTRQWFNQIDNVIVWDRPLTAAEAIADAADPGFYGPYGQLWPRGGSKFDL